MVKKWEIISVDTGKRMILTNREAIKLYGKEEWHEISQGYAPHLVVAPWEDEWEDDS